jgi:hypothetical protein
MEAERATATETPKGKELVIKVETTRRNERAMQSKIPKVA